MNWYYSPYVKSLQQQLSKEQLQSLGLGNALAVTSSQAAQLSDEQLQGLQAARDGLREGLSSQVHPTVFSSLQTGTVSAGILFFILTSIHLPTNYSG